MSGGATGDGAPQRGWMRPALIVSLAFNLLFVGLVAGAFWKRHHDKWRPRHLVLELSVKEMMKELPAEKRAAGERVLEDISGMFPESWREIRTLRKEALDALTADPYVEERLAEAMAKLREVHDSGRKARHDAVLAFIRGMTPQERQRFIEVYKGNKRGPWNRSELEKKD